MLCSVCEGINVTDLVELAKANYGNLESGLPDEVARPAFLKWRHWIMLGDLVAAAREGCELCRALVDALGEEVRDPGEGVVTYMDALVKMEGDGSFLGFHVTIDSEDKEFHGSMGPGMIPRDRTAYLKGRFAGVESMKNWSTVGNSSTAATPNAGTPVPPAYVMSYQDMILDRLSFHVESKGSGHAKQSLAPLVFSLQVPRGQSKFVGPLRIGHFSLDPDLGSETNFDIARYWIQNCSENHYECPPMDDKPLPSRVINVGSDIREPFLVMTNHKKGRFIALSHCWGGSVGEKAKLTAKTAESFKDKIPMADLPGNFADAVLITRGLGFENLWIDCLCIMQDSREDWDIESKHMGDVYRDAVITLAASAASKATDGMLHTFSAYDLNGGPAIKLKVSRDSSPDDVVDIVRSDSTREDLGHLLQCGPLANRGWTLQEEILSPRTLYYGLQQIHWQCLHHYSSADGIHDYDVHWKRAFRYERIKDRIFKQTQSPDQDPHNPKKHQSDPGGDDETSLSPDARFRSSTPGFPSWSWARVTGKLHNLYTKILLPTRLDPSLISHNIVPMSLNPYGAIQSAELCIDGYTLPMRAVDHMAKHPTSGEIFWDPDPEITGKWGRKSPVWMVRKKEGDSWLVIGQEDRDGGKRSGNGNGKKDIAPQGKAKKLPYKILFIASHQRYAYGLVLKKAKGTNANTDANTVARHENENEDEDGDGDIAKTDCKSRDKDADDMEVDGLAKMPPKIELQDESLDSEVYTYSRIGLIKLQIKVATKNWNLNRFKWLDLKWERQKLRLI
ncbi:hypothetical protein DID88_005694 [Monilinia fructigena]|uniref:Heterokaryon incompatibility domain-containing protein n=1 Tax=Monilinia fructigena TaxID=38457 RepID=A0A395J2W5_9HELO|nr:hypothetical protein DID88_005694 [Monilinia fructigena]